MKSAGTVQEAVWMVLEFTKTVSNKSGKCLQTFLNALQRIKQLNNSLDIKLNILTAFPFESLMKVKEMAGVCLLHRHSLIVTS